MLHFPRVLNPAFDWGLFHLSFGCWIIPVYMYIIHQILFFFFVNHQILFNSVICLSFTNLSVIYKNFEGDEYFLFRLSFI